MKIKGVITKKLGRRRLWGEADHETGIIYIDPRCIGRKDLEITIHESSHILQPYLSEEAICDIAAELTRVLWERGYRRADHDSSVPLQDE